MHHAPGAADLAAPCLYKDITSVMPAATPFPRHIAALILATLACSFAGNHIAARIAFDHDTGLLLAMLCRSGVTLLALAALVLWRGESLRMRRQTWGWQLMLGLLRDAGHPHMVAAPCGQYQQSLKESRNYQLLRLRIDEAMGLIPEVSANRLLVSIRLMRADSDGKLKLAADTDAGFELTLCA